MIEQNRSSQGLTCKCFRPGATARFGEVLSVIGAARNRESAIPPEFECAGPDLTTADL